MNNVIFGTIFGDIVGSVYETNNTKDYNFRLLSFKSTFTDDTILTIATADWLANGGCISSYYDVYGNQFKERGFGKGFTEWLNKPIKEPYSSNGNGSAMRVSPVGCYASSIEEAMELAEITASCSHNGTDGIEGAKFVAAAIFLLSHGAKKEDTKEKLKELFSYNLDIKYDDVQKEYGWQYGATNQGTVPYAFIAFFESTNFEDAIRKAVSLGGDSDTIAAICGGMAGAYYGVPNKFENEVVKQLPLSFILAINNFNLVVDKRNKKDE